MICPSCQERMTLLVDEALGAEYICEDCAEVIEVYY